MVCSGCVIKLDDDNNKTGISPVVATIIIIAVAIAIGIAFSFWVSGILSAIGYGTRPIMLSVWEFRIYGSTILISVKNSGGDTVYINRITINGRWEPRVLSAYLYGTSESRISWDGDEYLIRVDPGEFVEIWCLAPEDMKIVPGHILQVEIGTTIGFASPKDIKVERGALVPPTLDIYIHQRNVTYSVDFIRMKWLIHRGVPGNFSDIDIIANGSLVFLDTYYIEVNDTLKQQPVIVVKNPLAGKDNYIIWMNHNDVSYEWGSGYYNLSKVDEAVPYLDFIIFFEDLWNPPNNAGDADYNEHVTRVTWLRDGSARVAVYFGAHGYTFDVYVGGKYVYTISGSYHNITRSDYKLDICDECPMDDLREYLSNKVFIVKP